MARAVIIIGRGPVGGAVIVIVVADARLKRTVPPDIIIGLLAVGRAVGAAVDVVLVGLL
jgi:hypothetical protein